MLAGCGPDPCETALEEGVFSTGDANLTIRLEEEDGSATTGRRFMRCVDVLVLSSGSYADTLASGRVQAGAEKVVLTGLGHGDVDVIVDAPNYYPVKFTDVTLKPGPNLLPDKVLMFRTNVDVVLPGYVGVTLRPGGQMAHLRDLYAPFGQVRMQAAPGNHYELRLPFRGTRPTRRDVENLLEVLVRSPQVQEARPLVTLTAAIRAAAG